MKSRLFFCVTWLLLIACTPPNHNHNLRIAATNWIGYTPLFYAKEKGWLELLDIKLTNVVSLSENMYLFKAGNADAFTGTQYEYSFIQQQNPSLVPIILFNRSNGGDMIMSNYSVSELQESTGPIDTYLEMDSINVTLLNDFIRKFEIDESRINYLNRDPSEISSLTNTEPGTQILIVTYIPFDKQLTKNGFTEISSTKNGLDLLVIDALYTRYETLAEHKTQFEALKKLVDEAIMVLAANPEEYYETVKPYFSELSYEDFMQELNDIVWINKDLDPVLKTRMQNASLSTKNLL